MAHPMRKHMRFAAGVGVVLAVIFLIAALAEPFAGELEMQTILVPAKPLGAMILVIAAAFGF